MRIIPYLLAFLLLPGGTLPTSAQVLFSGAQNLSPGAQGWAVVAFPATAAISDNGVFSFDGRTGGQANRGGISITSPTPIRTDPPTALRFSLQVTAEAHANPNRAGVSVICLSDDLRGIELGFWVDRVWAQASSPLFVHAEESLLNTTAGLMNYELRFSGEGYELKADGQPVLTGPLRNYSSFAGFPNVYALPNFIFVGDNTTSASGAFVLQSVELEVSLAPIPIPEILRRDDGTLEIVWPAAPAGS